MFKNNKLILTGVLPVVISIILGIVIISVNSTTVINMRARTTVNSEKEQMEKDIKSFEDEKISLQRTAAELDKKIENNKILVNEIGSLEDELNNYNNDINQATATIGQLDISISEKAKYIENLDKLNNQTVSHEKVYTNIKLNVPNDISAGRYTASGTGKIYIYTIANTLQEKQDLAILDSHSYTFNITSGQYIKIEGTLTLTGME